MNFIFTFHNIAKVHTAKVFEPSLKGPKHKTWGLLVCKSKTSKKFANFFHTVYEFNNKLQMKKELTLFDSWPMH